MSSATANRTERQQRFVDIRSATELARGDLLRLELAAEKGTYVEAAAMRRELAVGLATTREHLLAIPERLAARLAACSDEEECRRLVDADIRLALRQFEAL